MILSRVIFAALVLVVAPTLALVAPVHTSRLQARWWFGKSQKYKVTPFPSGPPPIRTQPPHQYSPNFVYPTVSKPNEGDFNPQQPRRPVDLVTGARRQTHTSKNWGGEKGIGS